LFRLTLVIILPNKRPLLLASILYSADNILFLKLKLLYYLSSRIISSKIESLGKAKLRSKLSCLILGRITQGKISIEKVIELRQLKRRSIKLKKDI
jgi:hypothetical protein